MAQEVSIDTPRGQFNWLATSILVRKQISRNRYEDLPGEDKGNITSKEDEDEGWLADHILALTS